MAQKGNAPDILRGVNVIGVRAAGRGSYYEPGMISISTVRL